MIIKSKKKLTIIKANIILKLKKKRIKLVILKKRKILMMII